VPRSRNKAELLEQLAERVDLSAEERAVLREAAAVLRDRGTRRSATAAVRGGEPSTRSRARPTPGGSAELEAILWTDGGARGNPGPAGAGAILKDIGGATLATCSKYLGHTTNNVAEYRALILGLERARELGITRIEVRADSQLLIRQLEGTYRVKNAGLKPLFTRASGLLEQFEYAKLTHVPREQNAEADQLANEGIDSA
jgi:ribonuclease HI